MMEVTYPRSLSSCGVKSHESREIAGEDKIDGGTTGDASLTSLVISGMFEVC